jgi:hypothetical protein
MRDVLCDVSRNPTRAPVVLYGMPQTGRTPCIVELDRRPAAVKARDLINRTQRETQHAWDLQKARERGFMDGVAAANAGLAANARFARGTRDLPAPDEEPTAPYPIVDLECV